MNRPSYFFARVACVAALLAASACGGCSSDEIDNNENSCAAGEIYNPITGTCGSTQTGNNGLDGGDPGNEVDGDSDAGSSTPDSSNGPDAGTDADTPEPRCQAGVDSDSDGLDDACECDLATSPLDPDTDGDGLTDAEEDADGNCRFGPGETDPRQADTDQDGASDAREIAEGTDPLNPDGDGDGVPDGAELDGCTDPGATDSDGDGLPDGVEDGNQDGMLGSCPNRMYEPACAQGESDPCLADTDGDGTPDQDEAQYRTCRPQDFMGLLTPQLVVQMTADYQLALEANVATSVVTPAPLAAHTFEDAAQSYTGFIASLPAPNSETNPSRLSDHVVAQVQAIYPAAVRRVAGRQITTHDNFKAVVGGIIDLPAGTSLDGARDAVLRQLSGEPTAASTLTTAFPGDSIEPTLFVYEVLSRSASQYVVAGALVTLPNYEDDAAKAGVRVDDIVGGTSIAGALEGLTDDCVSYAVTVKPKVDIIVSIDGSGSMNDEQQALQDFAVDFTTLLTNSNLDWRVGVTRPDCGDNTGLSPEAEALFANNSNCVTVPVNFPGFPGTGKTGELVGGDFTADPMELQSRLDPGVFSGGGEFTISALTAAADRALPRDDLDAAKFRDDAAVILVAITDEEDAFFQDSLSFGNSQTTTLDATQTMELETETQPWVDYLLTPELGATAFGIVWPPGEQCSPNGAAVAHAIGRISNETGGSVGSICQTDITNTLAVIADASAGIASGLRLRGVPVAATVQVTHGQASTGNIVPMDRSRISGFDYDSIVNRVSFTGPNPPQTNDRVVIPYRRWDGSVFMCTTTADCPAEQKLKCVDGECR